MVRESGPSSSSKKLLDHPLIGVLKERRSSNGYARVMTTEYYAARTPAMKSCASTCSAAA